MQKYTVTIQILIKSRRNNYLESRRSLLYVRTYRRKDITECENYSKDMKVDRQKWTKRCTGKRLPMKLKDKWSKVISVCYFYLSLNSLKPDNKHNYPLFLRHQYILSLCVDKTMYRPPPPPTCPANRGGHVLVEKYVPNIHYPR
jgi:hypothetical protein